MRHRPSLKTQKKKNQNFPAIDFLRNGNDTHNTVSDLTKKKLYIFLNFAYLMSWWWCTALGRLFFFLRFKKKHFCFYLKKKKRVSGFGVPPPRFIWWSTALLTGLTGCVPRFLNENPVKPGKHPPHPVPQSINLKSTSREDQVYLVLRNFTGF